MTATNLDWNYIVSTDEYQDDLNKITPLCVQSLGIENVIDNTNPFIFVIANLVSIHRYFIRHLKDNIDIDLTPFINLIQEEIGLNLPLTSNIPVVEWIRENKTWYGKRGTLSVYPFIGAISGSPLEVDFLNQLIFKLDDPKSCLSGAMTQYNSPLPFAESKLARIRDGIYWAQFTYLVTVLQAQEVITYTDLVNLLTNVHPAGTKMFLKLNYNYMLSENIVSLFSSYEVLSDNFYIGSPYPTLDNNWILSGGAKLSMHNGNILLSEMNVIEIPFLNMDFAFRELSSDTLTNVYIGNMPWTAVQRGVSNNDGTYTQVFADSDSLVYENTTTNLGMGTYTYEDTNTLNYRQIQFTAFNLDQANIHGQQFMPNLLDINISVS